ncbi:MAG: hypothetical protein HQRvContig05_6 [Haloquadratum phage sp.]|nr:MAG: hypothetical protein HQRvContig05_6 [Haloquadratum phage sp.]
MSNDYLHYHVDKRNLTLWLALCAAVFAFYAYKEARESNSLARRNLDPIEVDCEATDPENVEETDD